MRWISIRFFLEENWKKIFLIVLLVILIFLIFPVKKEDRLDLSKFEDPAVKPAELSFVKVSKYGKDTEVRILDKRTDDPIPTVKIAITDIKNHEGRYVAFAEDELRHILNQPEGDLVLYNRHDSEAKPKFLVEGRDYRVVDFQGEKVYVIRFERFSTNTLIVQAWSGTYLIRYLNAVNNSNFSFYLRGNITNATIEFIGQYVGLNDSNVLKDTFDNSNGGNWSRLVKFESSERANTDAQYLIEINRTTWTLYSPTYSTELTGTVSDFWDLVQPDGDDIRVFNNTNSQLYFRVERWDYTNQSATIWVNLPAGSSEINIAYGNSLATKSNYENPYLTFEFFDDFEGTSLDTNKWTIINGTLYSVSNSELTLSDGTRIASTQSYDVQNTAIRIMFASVSRDSGGYNFFGFNYKYSDTVYVNVYPTLSGGDYTLEANDGSTSSSNNIALSQDINYHIWDLFFVEYVPNKYFKAIADKSYSNNVYLAVSGSLPVKIGTRGSGIYAGTVKVDWIAVRSLEDPIDFVKFTVSTFDEGWQKNAGFTFTGPAIESAQYKLVINGTTWELYNVTGGLKGSLTVSDFWDLVQPDGDDIRVFNNTDSQLYFRVESWDYTNQSATIWVNLTAGSTELNIAYGNPSATKSAYEDPTQVFDYYDDFSTDTSADYTIVAAKADGTTSATFSVSNGIASIAINANGNAIARTNHIVTDNFAIELDVQVLNNVDLESAGIVLVGSTEDIAWYLYTRDTTSAYLKLLGKWTSGGFTQLTSATWTRDTNWHKLKLEYSAGTFKLYYDGTLETTHSYTLADASYYVGLLGNYYAGAQHNFDNLKVYKLADPVNVSGFHLGSFSTLNPRVLLNGNTVQWNGTLNSGESSGRIPINLTWLRTGINNLTFQSDYGSADVVIRATYTDDVNITITRLFGVEKQTLEYIPVENTTNASVRLVFSTTDVYHQLWNVTVNGNPWTNYNWSFPHLDVYLGDVSANITYNITAEMGYNNPPTVIRDDIRTVRGKSIIFSAMVTDPEEDNIVSWMWDFGDGTNSTQQNPTHSYSVLGTYNCSVTVTDDGNVQPATAIKTFKVYVENQLPAVSLVEPANNDYLTSTTVKFVWNGSDPDVDFDTPYFRLYVDGNLVFEGYGTSYTMNLTAGQHTWYVTVTDGIETIKSETRTLYVLSSPSSSSEPTSVPVITSAIIAPYPAVVNHDVYIAYTAFDPDGILVEGRIRVTDPSGTNIDLFVSSAEDLYYGIYKPLTTGTHTVTLLPLDDSGVSASLSIPLEVYATPSKEKNILELRKTADAIFVVSKNAKILSTAKTYGDRLIINIDLSMTNETSVTVDATSLDFSDISRIIIDPKEGLSPLKQPVELEIRIPIKALVVLDGLHLITNDYGAGSVKYDSQMTVIIAKVKDTITLELNKNPSRFDEIIHRLLAYLDSIILKI